MAGIFLLLGQEKVTKKRPPCRVGPTVGLPSVAGENGAVRKLALRAQTDGSHDSRFRLQPKLRRRGQPLIPTFSPEGRRKRKRRLAQRGHTLLDLLLGPLVALPSSTAEARVLGEHCLSPQGELRSRALGRAAQGSPSLREGPAHRVAFSLVPFFWPSKRKIPAVRRNNDRQGTEGRRNSNLG